MTTQELHELIRALEKTPLRQLSDMEKRTTFEFMLQLGYEILPPRERYQSN